MFVARIPPAKNVIALFCDRKISFAPASGLQWICVRMHSGEKSREGELEGEGGFAKCTSRQTLLSRQPGHAQPFVFLRNSFFSFLDFRNEHAAGKLFSR